METTLLGIIHFTITDEMKNLLTIEEIGNVSYVSYNKDMPKQGREYSSETEDCMKMLDRLLMNRSAKMWRNILLLFPAVVSALPKENSIMLELGCSIGNLRTYLYRNGPETYYIGLDARKEVLQIAMEEIFTRPYGLVEYDLNLEWLFESEVFDVVAFYDTLEHLPDRDTQIRILKEIYDSLKDEGVLLLSTACKNIDGNNAYDDFHTSEIDKETFEKDIKKIGYFIDETFALDFHDGHEDWNLSFQERQIMHNFRKRGFHSSALRAIFGTNCNNHPRNVFYRLVKIESTLLDDIETAKKRFITDDICTYIVNTLEDKIIGVKFLKDYVRLTLSSNDEIYVYDKKKNIVRIEIKIEFVKEIVDYKEVTNSTCLATITNKHEAMLILERLLA